MKPLQTRIDRASWNCFTDDAEWRLMERTEVVRKFEGRENVVDFLLQFRNLRLEAIMSVRDLVVTAHNFTSRSGERVIATTLYQVPDRIVKVGECSNPIR
jgi:ketosteroid isomerase-like protein